MYSLWCFSIAFNLFICCLTDDKADEIKRVIITCDVKYTEENMCPCRCEYRRKLEHWGSKIVSNRTREELLKELESELQKIKKKLKVNKTQLSSSIRRRSSAPDKRRSSKTMGLAGAAFICIVVGLVVLMNLLSFVKLVKSTNTFWNTKKIGEKAKKKAKKKNEQNEENS